MPEEIKKIPEQYWQQPEIPESKEFSPSDIPGPVVVQPESFSQVLQPSGTVSVSHRKLSPLEQSVEQVLEEDLGDLYKQLTPPEQEEFRVKGETTATQVAALLTSVKIRVAEILQLIRIWLSTIPKINKYFIEQEAKIKVDKILRLKR